MDRRSFMKLAGAAGVAAAAKAVPAGTRKSKSDLRQAIIILGESVRYDMLNCNVKTGLHTPSLDRLAIAGVRFDRAYNCQPVCAPSRSAILTGLYPHTNGVWANSMPLGDTTHTVGQQLTDKGVHCAFIGKWHLDGFDYFGTGRPATGWDKGYWYDMRDYLEELSPQDRQRSRNPVTGNDPTWTAEYCYGHRCTNRAVDFLDKHHNEDFLLVVSYDEPHGPSLCPPEYSGMYENFVFPSNANQTDSLKQKPEEQCLWAKHLAKLPPAVSNKQFFGSHTFIDYEIGRILEKVEQQTPRALLIYTSDHGVFFQSHRLADKGPAMYDEITRVPFLAKWPGQIPANVRSSSLVSHIDISGTLMEFFGFEIPKTLEGGSMLALLKDPSAAGRSEVFMEWGRYEVDHDGFGAYQPIRCVFDGRYKLSVHLMTSDELYDLEADPSELENLIDSDNDLAARNDLHDRLLNWMNVSRDPFRGYYWGRRAWRTDFPANWTNAGMTRQRESDGYLPRELDYETGLPMQAATRPKK